MPFDITLKGKGYRLIGRTSPSAFCLLVIIVSSHGENLGKEEWKFGKGLKLVWGEERVKCCGDKWVFEFHADCR